MDPSLFSTIHGAPPSHPSSLDAELLALAQGQRASAEQFERLQRHLRAFQQAHGLPPSPTSSEYGLPPINPKMFQAPERVTSNRQGHHSYVIGGTRFDIPEQYTPVKLLGQGAYGIVIAAKDNISGDNVAIKKIPNAFANLTDTKRTLREIKLLRHLQHENVISLRDIFRPPSRAEFDDLYLVNELMDTDLHQIIASSNVLTDEHCQYFLYQVLRGLKYIHSANVLHRDLKPSNLLLNKDCLLKIADFGLARVEDDQEGFMTEYTHPLPALCL
jgi:serine/threonine protein kinase